MSLDLPDAAPTSLVAPASPPAVQPLTPTVPTRRLGAQHAMLVVLGAALLAALNTPAFGSYFLGEDFIYLGQLRAHANSYWAAVLSPTDHIFFRPVFSGINLLWQYVLPLDPWIHHLRNLTSSIVACGVLYLLLVQLRVGWFGRLTGVVLFAASKVHLTAIGYINTYDTIVSVTLMLSSVLFFVRFIQRHRRLDYLLGIAFTSLTIFTKDYGLAIIGVIVCLVACYDLLPRGWPAARRRVGWWLVRLAPLPVVALGYLVLRYTIVGAPPTSGSVYAPQFVPALAVHKVLQLAITVGNFAFFDPETLGAPGIAGWFGQHVLGNATAGTWLEAGLAAAFLALVAASLLRGGRRRGWLVVFVVLWGGGYVGPTLLTRNQQMYYLFEPLTAAAVLLALVVADVGPWLRAAWGLALGVIVLNAAASNYDAPARNYAWAFSTDRTQEIAQPLVAAHHGQPLESVTFVTDSAPFWQWALAADGEGPMVPELLGEPGLRVQFMDYATFRQHLSDADARHLFFDVDNGMQEYNPAAAPPAPLRLVALVPGGAAPNQAFNLQPDGDSALGVQAENASPATYLVMGGQRLTTIYVNATYLTAAVPADLLHEPHQYAVYLTNGLSESNQLEFDVQPGGAASASSAPSSQAANAPSEAPVLHDLSPPRTTAGVAFSVQPDGSAALSLQADNVVPGSVVVFDGQPLPTAYGNTHWLTASVPPELYSRPGRYDVFVRTGTLESNHVQFVVE